jgi:hypothetical protein
MKRKPARAFGCLDPPFALSSASLMRRRYHKRFGNQSFLFARRKYVCCVSIRLGSLRCPVVASFGWSWPASSDGRGLVTREREPLRIRSPWSTGRVSGRLYSTRELRTRHAPKVRGCELRSNSSSRPILANDDCADTNDESDHPSNEIGTVGIRKCVSQRNERDE